MLPQFKDPHVFALSQNFDSGLAALTEWQRPWISMVDFLGTKPLSWPVNGFVTQIIIDNFRNLITPVADRESRYLVGAVAVLACNKAVMLSNLWIGQVLVTFLKPCRSGAP